MRFAIGEFSRITGLPVRTLRFYHEKGILAPAAVDPASGYRYYDERSLERARVVVALRRFEFPLEEIATILAECDEEADLIDHLESQKLRLEEAIRRRKAVVTDLDRVIRSIEEGRTAMQRADLEVEEKSVGPLLVAAVRIRGKYSQCGEGFALLGKKVGRHIAGKPFCLHHDEEYREDNADFEACFPVRRKVDVDGIDVRELPACRVVSVLHRGPYDELGRAYERALRHAREHGYTVVRPTREIYLKGPGMIFRGNPRKYVTEIQLPVE